VTTKPRPVKIAPISPLCDKPDESKAIAAMVAALQAQSAPDPLRLSRHFEWLSLSNVTLPQACWILLGFDPWKPPTDRESSDASPTALHKRLLNRLECEVGAKKLKPERAPRPVREDRFRLLDVAARSRDIGFAVLIAEELLDVARQMKIIKPSRADSLPQRIATRLQWHRQFVASLPDEKKQPIPAKGPRKSPRRANPGAPINVRIAMIGREYTLEFCEFVRHQFGDPGYRFDLKMLKDDRQSLHVELKGGYHAPLLTKAKPQKSKSN
jgi:hypothetical protein